MCLPAIVRGVNIFWFHFLGILLVSTARTDWSLAIQIQATFEYERRTVEGRRERDETADRSLWNRRGVRNVLRSTYGGGVIGQQKYSRTVRPFALKIEGERSHLEQRAVTVLAFERTQ